MKILFTIILIALACQSISFAHTNEQPKKFTIIGSAIGLADSTLIYLDDISSAASVNIDSTFIINGKFKFSGTLKENIVHVIIRDKDFSNYKFFWLENSIITFTGEKGKFRTASIKGSKTQIEQDKLDLVINTTHNEKEQNILFIQNHLTSIISANILNVFSSSWGRDTTSMLYNKFSKKVKNTLYGKNIAEFIALNKNLKVGDQYVDFSQQNVQGKITKLSDFKGKIILLEFWGSWCEPCREGNPELVNTYHEFKDKGFEILGVAADNKKEDWINAVQKDGLPWQNVCDLKGDKNKAALIYGVSYYPCSFLINRVGIIIAKDLRGEELKQKLKELL